MVDVAHDHHNRGTGAEILLLVRRSVNETLFNGDNDFLFDFAAEFHCDQSCRVIIDHIGNGRKDAELDELLYDFRCGLLHAGSQIADGDRIGNLHLQGLLLGNLALKAVHSVPLLLAAFAG